MPVLDSAATSTTRGSATPTLAATKIIVGGHSYVFGAGASNTSGWAVLLGYDRLSRYGNNNYTVRGASGAHMEDVALGDITNVGTPVTVPLLAGVNGTGLVILEAHINNFRNNPNTTKTLTSFKNALRTLLYYYRCGSKIEDTSASNFVYSTTPAWTALSNVNFSNSTGYTTRAQNAYVDVTFPASTQNVALIIQGLDTAGGDVGAAWTLSEGGTTLQTGNTADTFAATPNRATTYAGPQAIVIAPTATVTGNRTVRLTKTDAVSGQLAVDCLLTPTANPATVLIMKDPQPSATGTSGTYGTDTNRLAFGAAIDAVIAEFPSDGSILTLDLAPLWVPAQHTGSDGLHPNDRGHALICDTVLAKLAALPYRAGQNTV